MRRALGAASLERIAPHITLVPPVNVPEAEIDAVADLARLAAQRSHPLRLELGGPATFFPVTPVLYLTVGGDVDAVADLRADLSTGPLAAPVQREASHTFVPHVTLDQNIAPHRIDGAIESLAHYRTEVTMERVTVLEFQETSRHWTPLSSHTLGRPRVVGRGGLEVELAVASMLDPAAARFQQREWAQYSREAYGDDVAIDEPFAVVARVRGEIAGTATGELRGRLCHLGLFVVAPQWRSQGIGSQILRTVEQLAREGGAEVVRLETRAGGPAEELYRARGYEVVAPLPGWREGRDFVVMDRRLA